MNCVNSHRQQPALGSSAFHALVVTLMLSLMAPAVADQTKAIGGSRKGVEPTGSLAATQLFTRNVEAQNEQQWDKAVSGWRNLLAKFPHDSISRQARNYLGVCLLQQQKYNEAALEFAQVVEDNGKDAMAEEALLNLGLCYYSKGFQNDRASLRKAAKILDAHTSKYPQGAFRDQALYYLAESLSILEEHEKAAKYYQQLISSYPESPLRPDAMRAMAVGQLDRGQSEQAQSTFSKLAAEYPDDDAAADAQLQRAEALLAAGKIKQAAELFTQVAGENEKSADYALLRCGLCYEHAEDFAAAARTYEKLVKLYPSSEFIADALLGAGRAYGLAQDTTNAERCLTKIKTDNADTAMEVAHWRCRVQLFSGNAREAVEIAQNALVKHEDAEWRVEVLLDQAEALSLIPEKQTLAAAKYIELAKSLPDGELLWRSTLGAADCLLQIQRFAEAERIAEAFLSSHATNEHRPAFQFIAAESERLQGHHDSAQTQFKELIKLFPDHPMVTTWRTRLAYSYSQCDRLDQVLEVLGEIQPDRCDATHYAEALYLRGQTLRKLERLDAAAQAFRTAQEADPTGPWAEQSQLAISDVAPYLKDSQTTKANQGQADKIATRDTLGPKSRNSSPRAPSTPRENELYSAALLAIDGGNLIGAIQRVSDLLADFPNSPLAADALLYIGESTYADGDYNRAEKIFRKAAEQHGVAETTESAIYKLGWSQSKLAKHRDALVTFTRLADRFPQGNFVTDARYMQAECHFKLDQFDDALKIFKQLRAQDDLEPQLMGRVLFWGARCLQKTGAWNESIVWLREMMKSDPQAATPQSQLMIGLAYEKMHDHDMALRHYRIAADSDHRRLSLQARLQVARCLFQKGKFSDAMPYFEEVITKAYEADPDSELRQMAFVSAVEAAECSHQLAEITVDDEKRFQWQTRSEQLLELADQDEAREEIRQAARQLEERF